jgi:transitional endoplasmic reticulum ATPase
MTEKLENLLEDATHEFRDGLAARERGDNPAAREHLLQAAEKLFEAAAASTGKLRDARKRQAQEVYREAHAIPIYASSPARASTPPLTIGSDEQAGSWLIHEKPSVRFADIAGLEEVKEQIRLKLLYPFTHRDIAETYGIQAGGGILLYGPPGTGKTMIARAVAGEIDAAFFAIKPSEIMSQWVGVAEQNLQRLFAEAQNYPVSVIFVDEMESLAPKRRSQQSTVMARVVPQLLAELDGFEKRRNPLLLIGATNEPWAIDSAILRPGRLDRLIYVPPPDPQARQKILELNLKDIPLAEDVFLDRVAERCERFSGADMAALARRARERVFSEAVRTGDARPLAAADFDAVLAEMRSSINIKDLRLFEEFTVKGA